MTSLDELAVNLDWSPSSLGAPETVNTYMPNVGGRDWLQVRTSVMILDFEISTDAHCIITRLPQMLLMGRKFFGT